MVMPVAPPPQAPRPHASRIPTQVQTQLDLPSPETPADPPSAPERPRFELER
jgi:hypothetical protein